MYRGGPKKRHNMWLIASFFKTAAKNLPQQLVFPVVRFSWEDFLIYDLIYQSQPHQPTSFLGVVVKAKTNPILQTQITSFVQSQKQKIEENPESENMKKIIIIKNKKSNISLQWVTQGHQLGRMLMSKDPNGQVKHGLTLPKSKELWKKETIVWYCTWREAWNPRRIKEVWWGKI